MGTAERITANVGGSSWLELLLGRQLHCTLEDWRHGAFAARTTSTDSHKSLCRQLHYTLEGWRHGAFCGQNDLSVAKTKTTCVHYVWQRWTGGQVNGSSRPPHCRNLRRWSSTVYRQLNPDVVRTVKWAADEISVIYQKSVVGTVAICLLRSLVSAPRAPTPIPTSLPSLHIVPFAAPR